jgi:ketosteroid isomerase-like protein
MNKAEESPVDVVLRFIERINAHDVQGMCALMSADHRFVDSLGEELRGREEMRRAWLRYFYLFPDFSITCHQVLHRNEDLALFGTAQGSYAVGSPVPVENRWQMPAAWHAVVRDGLVAEWQVYADNEPVRRLMALQG